MYITNKNMAVRSSLCQLVIKNKHVTIVKYRRKLGVKKKCFFFFFLRHKFITQHQFKIIKHLFFYCPQINYQNTVNIKI